MKFTAKTSELRSTVQKAASATGGQIPIMGNVLLQITGKIRVTGGDGERKTLVAECNRTDLGSAAGGICLPANRLSAILGEADGDFTEIEITKDNRAVITSGRGEWELAGEAAKEYPELPELGDSIIWTLPAKEFGEKLSQVFPARAATGLGRPHLETVHIALKDGNADYVATDGRRLALATGKINGPDSSVTLPEDAARTIIKYATEGDMTLKISGVYAVAELEGMTLYFRLLEASYPNWKHIMPTAHEGIATVNLEELLAAIKKVAQIGEDQNNLKRLKLEFADDKLSLSITHQHASRYAVPCKTDGNLAIHFNADLFYQLLSGCPSEEITCEWQGENKAFAIQAGAWVGIIMPLYDGVK